MPVLAGILFALGVAGLLFAVTAVLPGAPFPPVVGPASAGVGLVGLGASWLVLLGRNARLERALDEAHLRVAASTDDVRRARAALGDAEQSLQSGVLGTELAPLLAEWLDLVHGAADDPGRVRGLVATMRGLARGAAPTPTALHDLVGDAAHRAETLLGTPLVIDQAIEVPGTIAVDRERVVGLLVQVLAAAREVSAPGRPVRVEIAEWQAGLLRLVVTAPDARGTLSPPRHAGLLLAAAQARAMGGSLAWHDGTAGERRTLLLLPLEAEDAPTDPGSEGPASA